MNKKIMKCIEKELKNNNEIIIKHIPTQEEIDYLKSRRIITEKVFCDIPGLLSDKKVVYEFTKYSNVN